MTPLRRLPSLTKSVRLYMIFGIALACLAALASFGLLFLSGWLLAGAAVAGISGVAAQQAFNILLPATGVRFFAMLRILSRYGEKLITHDGALRVMGQLRSWCYHCLAPQAPAGLHNRRGGDLLSRFVTDTDLIGQHYTSTLLPYIRAVVCGSLFVLIMAIFSPQAALCLATGLLFSGLILPYITGLISDRLAVTLTTLHSQNRTDLADLIAATGEYLAPAATRHLHIQFTEQQLKLNRSHRLMAATESAARGLTTLCTTVTSLAVLLVATNSFHKNYLSLPEVPMLVLGCLTAFDIITPLPAARQLLSRTKLAAQRLYDACMTPPLVAAPIHPVHPDNADFLEISDLSFRYPGSEQWIFRHAGLNIQKGERVALIGPSGTGKSSLIQILFRFYPFEAGSCHFGERDICDMQSETLSEKISVAPQNFHLFNGTVRDNMLLASPQATEADIMQALQTAGLTDWLNNTPYGLETTVGNEGFQISGGQARRLCLAQILLRKTPWLILDEPTEGLDAETEKTVLTNLIQARPDMTLICITHRRSVLPFMTRAIQIRNGQFHPAEEI